MTMSPTRVAFDVGPLHGPRTGIGAAVAAMHTALSTRHDVTLRDYLLSYRAKVGAGGLRLPLPAALAHRLWSRVDRPTVDRWLGDAEVVHGTNYVVPPSKRPRLVSVYDCWFLRNPSLANPAVRRAGEVLRRSVDGGATVHACSHSTADAVREQFPRARVFTVPLGALPVPAAAERAPIPEIGGRRFIVAIGTLERRKNIPTLVRAFAEVAAADSETYLVLAGGHGDDSASIDQAIDALGPLHAQRVLLTGRIDEATRGWLLRNAAVLAYPSLDEGFGFPLLDAMQVGLPIVASDAGSIPEITDGAALLCPPTEQGALAANLLRALGDSETIHGLRSAGAAQWQRYTWSRCADGLAQIYRQLDEGNRS
jgi:glycosyltransferase involved in cell wall biosynthesis